MIKHYLERSLWYNAQLRNQVANLGLKSVSVNLEMPPEEIAEECMRVVATNNGEFQ